MHPVTWRDLATTLVLMLTIAASASAQPRALEPWIRAMPPSAPAYAGYVEIHNEGPDALTLTGASSDAFAHIMLHETLEQDGVMKMLHRDKVPIAAGARLSLRPGGMHLMLMRPSQPVSAGARFDIVLQFEDGSSLPVTFVVRRDQ